MSKEEKNREGVERLIQKIEKFTGGPLGPRRPADPDESLTTEEYIKAGMPDPDRVWSAADLAQAEEVIAGFARDAQQKMPRNASPRSGKMFARLVSIENLNVIKDTSIPVETRMQDGLACSKLQARLMLHYGLAFSNFEGRGADHLEAQVACLRTAVCLVDLIGEIKDSLDPSDPAAGDVQKHWQDLKPWLAGMLPPCWKALEDPEYTLGERSQFVGSLQGVLPGFTTRLVPADQSEIIAALSSLCDSASLLELRPQLQQLREMTQGALKSGCCRDMQSELNAFRLVSRGSSVCSEFSCGPRSE